MLPQLRARGSPSPLRIHTLLRELAARMRATSSRLAYPRWMILWIVVITAPITNPIHPPIAIKSHVVKRHSDKTPYIHPDDGRPDRST